MDIHVQADRMLPLWEAHVLSGKVKGAIRSAIANVAGVLGHMEPYEGESAAADQPRRVEEVGKA